jgi:DNA polymerase
MSKFCENNPEKILKRLIDMGEDEILLYLGKTQPEDDPVEQIGDTAEIENDANRMQMNANVCKECKSDGNLPLIASTLDQLEESIKAGEGCAKCPLAEGRNKIVVGMGDPKASIVFIGEGPGAEEDKTGLPFVGRAGQLLDRIFEAMGLSRESGIYICNIVKCRPPNNRDPLPDEAAACIPYLMTQIDIIKPAVICCLGRVAAQNLLNTDASLGNLRDKIHYFRGIPVVVTYHPAYLLRNPAGKKPTWEDMKKLLQIAGLSLPNPNKK